MRDVHLKKASSNALKEIEWLLHRDRYVGQYYSERYNRDVQMFNLEN